MDKKELRKLIKTQLQNYSSQLKEKSSVVCKKILKDNPYKNADIILAYMALDDEVDLSPLLKQAFLDKKTVYLPKVELNSTKMDFYKYSENSSLNNGAYGIFEPSEVHLFDPAKIENSKILVLVPGRAFTKEGHRLGRGKAYYDTYITRLQSQLPSSTALTLCGVCFDLQIITKIPLEAHDKKMDIIYSDGDL